MIFLIHIFFIIVFSQDIVKSSFEPLLEQPLLQTPSRLNQGALGVVEQQMRYCYNCASQPAEQSPELAAIGDKARNVCAMIPAPCNKDWNSLSSMQQNKIACGCLWGAGCVVTSLCCIPCCYR